MKKGLQLAILWALIVILALPTQAQNPSECEAELQRVVDARNAINVAQFQSEISELNQIVESLTSLDGNMQALREGRQDNLGELSSQIGNLLAQVALVELPTDVVQGNLANMQAALEEYQNCLARSTQGASSSVLRAYTSANVRSNPAVNAENIVGYLDFTNCARYEIWESTPGEIVRQDGTVESGNWLHVSERVVGWVRADRFTGPGDTFEPTVPVTIYTSKNLTEGPSVTTLANNSCQITFNDYYYNVATSILERGWMKVTVSPECGLPEAVTNANAGELYVSSTELWAARENKPAYAREATDVMNAIPQTNANNPRERRSVVLSNEEIVVLGVESQSEYGGIPWLRVEVPSRILAAPLPSAELPNASYFTDRYGSIDGVLDFTGQPALGQIGSDFVMRNSGWVWGALLQPRQQGTYVQLSSENRPSLRELGLGLRTEPQVDAYFGPGSPTDLPPPDRKINPGEVYRVLGSSEAGDWLQVQRQRLVPGQQTFEDDTDQEPGWAWACYLSEYNNS